MPDIKTMWWSKGTLKLIDQRKLPLQEKVVTCRDYNQVIAAIKNMVVRGAPAIGITGAYGLALAGLKIKDKWPGGFKRALRAAADKIAGARPTATNLVWAVERCYLVIEEDGDIEAIRKKLLTEAHFIAAEEMASCLTMGRYGEQLIKKNWKILTHCNAGGLATLGLGTALAPIKLAHRAHKNISVWVGETRPFLQGSRLTAYEMKKEGIPFCVITDSMAAHFMSRGEVDCVITGADRIASNGDSANKIGTLGLALLAENYNIPFYVVAPSSTFDLSISSGEGIPIEERPAKEVAECGGKRIVPHGAKVRNPAFDVTPSTLITAIVSERGVIYPPYGKNIKRIIKYK